MTLHAELIREVEEGPSGPQIGAFFDLDRTLIATFSVFEFVRSALATGLMDYGELGRAFGIGLQFQLGQLSFSGFVAAISETLKGESEDEFTAMGERIFTESLAGEVYPESRALVEAHKRRGHTVAIVSAATPYQVIPLARDLDIRHVLATRLEVKRGRFTGKIVKPPCYGEGKAIHVRRLAAEYGLRVDQSYFYTDSDEDLPLLEIVGRPRPLNPNRRLVEIATARGWPTRTFSSRGTPGPEQVVRTVLTAGALVPSLMLGLPAAALNGSWRRAMNIVTSTWGEVGTAIAGINLLVRGEAHLWSHRPAVFIFNHQSGIDMMLLCKMLRRDMVGVAKQEIRNNPLWGPVFAMAGAVFIDRFNREKAIAALDPAIEALREGLSIVIAPEGTRSATPKLGKFKKGAFHIAMAAKVPIVPIVFRNTLDALPKHAIFVRPATVEAVVLPPIPTDSWHLDEIDQHVEQVRQLYLDTLAE